MSNGADGHAQARFATAGSEGTGETTVLIVDDHRCFADLLSAALGTVEGIRCLGTAASAAEGIEMVKELAPSVLRTAPARPHEPMDVHGELTVRELEVLGYIGQGLQAKSIAKVMGISVHTCRGYIKGVYAKLQVSSRIEAVNRARQLQLLDA
jgi:DNA-binding NarL/FixJ family response regulator